MKNRLIFLGCSAILIFIIFIAFRQLAHTSKAERWLFYAAMFQVCIGVLIVDRTIFKRKKSKR